MQFVTSLSRQSNLSRQRSIQTETCNLLRLKYFKSIGLN